MTANLTRAAVRRTTTRTVGVKNSAGVRSCEGPPSCDPATDEITVHFVSPSDVHSSAETPHGRGGNARRAVWHESNTNVATPLGESYSAGGRLVASTASSSVVGHPWRVRLLLTVGPNC